jgi:hypothetical protein
MPTCERRFYLGLLLKKKHEEQANQEEGSSTVSTAKGQKTTKVSGNALKDKIKSGKLPLN